MNLNLNINKIKTNKIMEKEILLPEDVKLEKVNMDLWKCPDGKHFGIKKEEEARHHVSTHKKCGCGNVIGKHYVRCSSCSSTLYHKRYMELEEVEWDGKSAMCVDDKFFFDMDEVHEYCDDLEINIKDLELVICEKSVHISEVNIDEMNEEYCTEDGDGVSHYHPEIAAKVEELNDLIRNATPKLWFGTDKRVKK